MRKNNETYEGVYEENENRTVFPWHSLGRPTAVRGWASSSSVPAAGGPTVNLQSITQTAHVR